MDNQSIYFQAQVLSNEDPMMLGRIRARRLIDNYQDIIRGITSPPWNEEKDAWSERDPFVFIPLIPYFIYQVPKVDEMTLVTYLNKDYKFQSQYYVQSTFSSPTTTNFEYYQGGNKFTGTGGQQTNPKPLKNNDGTYTDQAIHKGVFPEPGDNALLGRGSADVVVKENEVLIRAGKFKGTTLKPNVVPTGNPQRGFLQLSRFDITKNVGKNKKVTEFVETVAAVKYLIEWAIINPENTKDKFTGSVYLYKLKNDTSTTSKNLTVNSSVSEDLKILVNSQPFTALSAAETVAFINGFIQTCNNSDKTLNGDILFTDNNNKFPIFYRPNRLTYSYLEPASKNGNDATYEIASKNISIIYNQIKLQPALKTGGYGLIYTQGKVGQILNVVSKEVPQESYNPTPTTYGALTSDNLFLLSHKSQIPGKGKINFANTLYGIPLEQFVNEITPKTSSLVRGEELLELLNLIVRFLTTHTHAYPGLPPTPVTQDGSNVANILNQMQNAYTKILNQNIRLN
jgi:hypothetical protein